VKIPSLHITDINLRNGPRRSRLRRYGATAAALSLAGVLTAFAADSRDNPDAATAVSEADASTRTIGNGHDSYAPIIERVAPTVVTVRSTQRARAAEQQLPFMTDPFFRRFFDDEGNGPPVPQPRRQQGLGSGVIVRQDGYILTNHHVIDGAEKITVELSDRRSFTAKVVGSDAPSDLAVLKIDGAGFPSLPLGNSDEVRVGDVVLALGNPMGVGQTVTMGIISAKGRATGLGAGSFEDFLQTDAPINQGNSGGALVNTRGELVGINSQIVSMSGGNIGIGFAIPAKMAKHVMDALIEDGRVHRGMIGVSVQTVTPDLAESLRLDTIGGAIVSEVQDGSPAEKAGIRRGDVVTAIDGTPVVDSNALRNHVAQMQPGSKARLTVIRDGREEAVTVTLGELPAPAAQAGGEAGDGNTGSAGLTVQPVSPDVARRLELEPGTGVQVSNVDPSGPAAEAGFQRGDVIVEVDGAAVKSASDLRTALNKAGDRPALVLVRRNGAALYLPLSLS
jgi:Do/DeqQ family serine protease